MQPPPSWPRWKRPGGKIAEADIDDSVSQLIKQKQLKGRDELKQFGVPCPFWFSRASIVCAVETAELVRERETLDRKDQENKREKLDLLIEMPELLKNDTRLSPRHTSFGTALEDTINLHEETQNAHLWWRPGDLYLKYASTRSRLERVEKVLIDVTDVARAALIDVADVAREARKGVTNNSPNFFERAFAVNVLRDFALLTGLSSGELADGFVSAAWGTAFPKQEIKNWSRTLRRIRELHKPKT